MRVLLLFITAICAIASSHAAWETTDQITISRVEIAPNGSGTRTFTVNLNTQSDAVKRSSHIACGAWLEQVWNSPVAPAGQGTLQINDSVTGTSTPASILTKVNLQYARGNWLPPQALGDTLTCTFNLVGNHFLSSLHLGVFYLAAGVPPDTTPGTVIDAHTLAGIAVHERWDMPISQKTQTVQVRYSPEVTLEPGENVYLEKYITVSDGNDLALYAVEFRILSDPAQMLTLSSHQGSASQGQCEVAPAQNKRQCLLSVKPRQQITPGQHTATMNITLRWL
ncbi:hypothetical protein [Vagococcus sp. WN89Y]|uniref:hypothetical protein n=1 Tax=Vagococcus sp. WN89Y TaxID=3457258 RepID=UPI003FCCFC54